MDSFKTFLTVKAFQLILIYLHFFLHILTYERYTILAKWVMIRYNKKHPSVRRDSLKETTCRRVYTKMETEMNKHCIELLAEPRIRLQ